MILFILTQGPYGERIAKHIQRKATKDWRVKEIPLPRDIPELIDDPEEFIPRGVGSCDLLLAIPENPALTSILPPIAQALAAKAAIIPSDDPGWVPSGLRVQVREKLEGFGVASAFPKPFCTLEPNTGNILIDEFATHFGKPELEFRVKDGLITGVEVRRGAPCGCTPYVAEGLVGVEVGKATLESGRFFHSYPCLGSMEWDNELNETPLHIGGFTLKRAIGAGLRKGKTAT